MKKILSLIIALSLILTFAACAKKPAEETTGVTNQQTEPQATEPRELTEEEKILAQRRDIVEQYMRNAMTILWRSTENLEWSEGGKTFRVEEGKLYRGIPYTYASSTTEAFLDYAVGEPDENGIYTISGVQISEMDEGKRLHRLGMDCSSAVLQAWTLVSDTCISRRSNTMFQKYGVIPVGDIKIDVDTDVINLTGAIIQANGIDAMYQAYAQLQKGDAIVRVSGGSNHTRMVVGVDVVYNEDGSINTTKSVVTCLESTSKVFGSSFESEELGETVYDFCGIDTKYTFSMLLHDNYIPVTCQELVDASLEAAPEPVVTDSETEYTKDSLVVGTLTTNKHMNAITMTITDANGEVVQQAKVYHPDRGDRRTFDMQIFITETTPNQWGKIEPEALTAGDYHCTVVIRMANNQEVTARDFDFSI